MNSSLSNKGMKKTILVIWKGRQGGERGRGRARVPAYDQAWDPVTLRYAVRWPLHLLLTPEVPPLLPLPEPSLLCIHMSLVSVLKSPPSPSFPRLSAEKALCVHLLLPATATLVE